MKKGEEKKLELWVIGQSDTHSLQAKNKKVNMMMAMWMWGDDRVDRDDDQATSNDYNTKEFIHTDIWGQKWFNFMLSKIFRFFLLINQSATTKNIHTFMLTYLTPDERRLRDRTAQGNRVKYASLRETLEKRNH